MTDLPEKNQTDCKKYQDNKFNPLQTPNLDTGTRPTTPPLPAQGPTPETNVRNTLVTTAVIVPPLPIFQWLQVVWGKIPDELLEGERNQHEFKSSADRF